jgi:hypothetical protein
MACNCPLVTASDHSPTPPLSTASRAADRHRTATTFSFQRSFVFYSQLQHTGASRGDVIFLKPPRVGHCSPPEKHRPHAVHLPPANEVFLHYSAFPAAVWPQRRIVMNGQGEMGGHLTGLTLAADGLVTTGTKEAVLPRPMDGCQVSHEGALAASRRALPTQQTSMEVISEEVPASGRSPS